MDTFDLEVENLGPIRSAKFKASHFNLICGKNNSGKSMCMHAVFCFFRKWRSKVHLSAGAELASELVEKIRIKFDAVGFIEKLNPALRKSAKEFSLNLHKFLNKSKDQLKDCNVVIQMNHDYICDRLRYSSVNVFLSVTKTSKLFLRKEYNKTEAILYIENSGDGEFPSKGIVAAATNKLIDYLLVECILPRPYLMTAERSGSILYGDDLRTKSFLQRFPGENEIREVGVNNVHYAYPYVDELQNIWEAQSIPDSILSELDRADDKSDNIINFFGDSVALGEYKEREGTIYYRPKEDSREFSLNEASTSVRALMQLNDFIRRSSMESNLFLMIDEPELNLHPERQRALARFLVLLMKRRGVGVAISTHSDLIVREINTLIAFGRDVQMFSKIMRTHGYSDDEFLSSDEVACAIVENAAIEVKSNIGGRGFSITSFDETHDKINLIQDDIMSLWEQKDL